MPGLPVPARRSLWRRPADVRLCDIGEGGGTIAGMVDPALGVISAFFGVLFGAATGSFIGVVLYRVPRGESLGGRSHCACGRQLAGYENIPIVAWLVLRGRARCCGARIGAETFFTEVACAAVAAVAGFVFGPVGVVAAAALCIAAAYVVAYRRRGNPTEV